MNKRKQWSPQEKFKIVLAGMRSGAKISELCNEYGITQAMFYSWRNLLLENGAKVFARGGIERTEKNQAAEIERLKQTVGELHMELKKNDW